MSFISNIDHNDFFDNFDSHTDFKLLSGSDTTSIIFPKSHPLIRNLEKSLDKIAAELTKKGQTREEYYSKKQNMAFLEMMEATFSSEMPKSTRNRTPFADITDHELFKSNKPKLPKAPKNIRNRVHVSKKKKFPGNGGMSGNDVRIEFSRNKQKKSYSFSGREQCINVGFKQDFDDSRDQGKKIFKNFLKNNVSFVKKKENLKKRNRSLMSKKELEVSLERSKNEFREYKNHRINRSSDDSFKYSQKMNLNKSNLSFTNRNFGKKKFGLKLKNFLMNKMLKNKPNHEEKFEELKARKMKSRLEMLKKRQDFDKRKNNSKKKKYQSLEKKQKLFKKRGKRTKNEKKKSFQQFMKTTKTKNSLIKSLRQRICMEKILSIRRNSKSKSRSKEKNLKSIVPPIPINEVSKKSLREQITNGRVFADNISKTSTDELKTVKRKIREPFEELLTGEMTKDGKSSDSHIKKILIGNFKTKDERMGGNVLKRRNGVNESSSERNFKMLKNCLNSSEFLRSQLIRAKGYEPKTEPDEKQSGKKIKKKSQKKFHLNFSNMNMNLKSIYSQDNFLHKKHNNDSMIEDGPCAGQPRITRNNDVKGEKIIKFPLLDKKKKKSKSQRDGRYYSVSRQLLVGRVARKLVEIGQKGRRHKKSNSLSRSFGIFGARSREKRKSVDLGAISKA